MLILFIIIVIAGAIFLNLNRRSSPPTTQQKAVPTPTPFVPTETTVQLTDKGFTPSKVTIKASTAIHWKNTTDEKATINSDDHPTHKKFPELNLGELAKGQDLVHVFIKKGTYTYHNYYDPSQKGTIVVQ